MKFVGFGYDVEARVTITSVQLLNMLECAKSHYDSACVEAGQPGPRGFLWGWRNRLLDHDAPHVGDALVAEGEVDVTTRKLDLLLKILESPLATYGLYALVSKAYHVLEAEWVRLNAVQSAQNRLDADEVLAVRCGECKTEFSGPGCVDTLVRHRIAEHVRKEAAAS